MSTAQAEPSRAQGSGSGESTLTVILALAANASIAVIKAVAAMSIFVTGAMFSVFEGVRTIFGAGEEQTLAWVAFLLLALSFVMEGVSWIRAVRQIRREKDRDGQKLIEHLRATDDPTVKTILFEDTAALLGLLLAFAGVGLHLLTGSALWDGLASLLIGALLAVVAHLLGHTNMQLLIGRQADE